MILKNIKSFALVGIAFGFLASCDSGQDSRFIDTPTTGWVQFSSASSDAYSLTNVNFNVDNNIDVPVRLDAPQNPSDLTVNYSLEQVEGPNPNDFFNVSNQLIIPANTNGLALVGGPTNLTLNLNDAAGLTEAMVFDIALQSTNRSNVRVGFGDAPIKHRVSICPSLSSANNAFIGDYVLTVPTGVGPFGAQFEDGLVVSLSEGPNGELSRTFNADYLPAIGAGFPFVTIDFLMDVDNAEVTVTNTISTGVGCGAEILLIGGDASDLPCGDESIEINLLDFSNGSGTCGESDVPLTILLTKV